MISSSARPSLKYSFSGSELMLTNGSTATDGPAERSAASRFHDRVAGVLPAAVVEGGVETDALQGRGEFGRRWEALDRVFLQAARDRCGPGRPAGRRPDSDSSDGVP